MSAMECARAAVPVGRDNAKSARDIWRAIDCWAEVTVAGRLNDLAVSGEIQRCEEPCASGFKYLYWVEPE